MSPPVFSNLASAVTLSLSLVTVLLGLIFAGMGLNDQLPPVAQNVVFAFACAVYLIPFNGAFRPLKQKEEVDLSPRFYAGIALVYAL